MQKVVGKVCEEDKNNMIDICERKVALDNLEKIIDKSEKELYDKMLEERKLADEEYNSWWSSIGKKYNFEGDEKGYWKLDFQTGEIILVV